MKLADITVGFPVVEIKVRIHHSTPRPPTPIERVLLDMCVHFKDDASNNELSLRRVFEEILCLADPDPLVLPAIDELISLDVLRCHGDPGSLDTLRVRDLEPTDTGRRMLRDGLLPGATRSNDEMFHYDPVRGLMLSERESRMCREQAPAMALDEVQFREVFPEETIKDGIESRKFDWWTESTRIERLERLGARVLWLTSPGALELTGGSVRVMFADKRRTRYVGSLGPDEIIGGFISPVFRLDGDIAGSKGDLPVLDGDEDVEKDAKVCPLPDALDGFADSEALCMVDATAPLVRIPDAAGTGRTIVRCVRPADVSYAVKAQSSLERDGYIVDVAVPWPFRDAIAVSRSKVVRGRRVKAKVGRKGIELPVAVIQGPSDETQAVDRFVGEADEPLFGSEVDAKIRRLLAGSKKATDDKDKRGGKKGSGSKGKGNSKKKNKNRRKAG